MTNDQCLSSSPISNKAFHQSCGKLPVMPAKPAKFGRDRYKWLHSRTAWLALIISIVSVYMGSIPLNNKRVETKSHYVNMRFFSSMFHHYTVVWYENGRGVTIGSGISFGFTFIFLVRTNGCKRLGKSTREVSLNFLADLKAIEILKCTSVEDSKWAYERMYDETERVLVRVFKIQWTHFVKMKEYERVRNIRT
jgi:hypothetical protein